MSTLFDFLPTVFAFAAVLMLIPVARRIAIAVGFVDEPGGRKQHEDPVPPIGGLVIFPVYMVAVLLSGLDFSIYWPLFTALFMILITGALDDYRHIKPWIKFSVQLAASTLVVVAGGVQIHSLGNLLGFGTVWLGAFTIPFSILCVALLINAINLMDGLDGLAAGKSFIVLLWLILAGLLAHQPGASFAIAPMMGALLGFLYYNMRHPLRDKATIFLGDAGSMGLGLVLAWFCIGLAQEPDPVLVPISVAWVIALPVIDAWGQFFRRIREGKSPFAADRGHFHHHFIHAGFPVGQSTVLILTLGFILGGIGVLGIMYGVPVWLLTLGWMALFFVHIAVSLRPQIYVTLLSRFRKKKINHQAHQGHQENN